MTVFESLMMAIAFASLVVAILSFNHIEDFHLWGGLTPHRWLVALIRPLQAVDPRYFLRYSESLGGDLTAC